MIIQTTKGEMDESLLEKRVIPQDGSDDVSGLVATEYWLDGDLVHRSLEGQLIGRDLCSVQQPIGA